jgi:hypothetical protein
MYAVEVSPDLISTVIRVTVREEPTVRSNAIDLALDCANWKERKRWRPRGTIYGAPSAEAAGAALDAFERGPWGQKFATVVAS